MTWLAAIPEITLAFLWLFLPGVAVVLALGLRNLVAVLAAPVLSVGLLSALAVVFGVVGIAWRPLPVGIAVVVVAALVLLVRRFAVRRAGIGPVATADAGVRTHGSGVVVGMTLLGVVAGGLIAAVPIAQGLLPDLPPISWDQVFHLSATRFVIETADASPFAIQRMSQPDAASVPFYPAAWHGLVALVTTDSVVPATNAAILVVSGAVWPAGLAALARTISPGRTTVALIAPIVGAGFFAFPTFLMGWAWPNALAVALIPGTLAAVLMALARPGGGQGSRVAWVLAALLGLGGIGLAHPNGALTFGIMVTPLIVAALVGAAYRRARQGAPTAQAVLLGALAVAWCAAWWFAIVVSGRQLADTSTQGTAGMRAGLWAALTGGSTSTRGTLLLAVLIGVGAVVMLWQRHARWLLVSLAALVALGGLADSSWSLNWITAAWFWDPWRFRAPAAIVSAVVIAVGLAVIAQTVARASARVVDRLRTDEGMHGPLVTAISGALVVGLVAATGGLWTAERRTYFWDQARGVSQPESTGSMLTTPEIAMITRLGDTLPDDARVLGSPFTGTTLVYAVTGRNVVFPNFSGRWSADAAHLGLHLADIHQDPRVCEALDTLGVGYLYTDTNVYHYAHPFQSQFVGIPGEAPQPGFELLDEGGSARVYRITACG
ncbi:DUF6541 family protein [Xylanimonas cellulosilytica]|nr:DUF6541 family protein [Xylanimonas cellulosilytica]